MHDVFIISPQSTNFSISHSGVFANRQVTMNQSSVTMWNGRKRDTINDNILQDVFVYVTCKL